MKLNLPEKVKHVFFTASGYDDFRYNSEFSTLNRVAEFAKLREEEFAAKVRDESILSLPTDRQLMGYIRDISNEDF